MKINQKHKKMNFTIKDLEGLKAYTQVFDPERQNEENKQKRKYSLV